MCQIAKRPVRLTSTVKCTLIDLKDKLSFNRAVDESWPYFNAIARICEGRSSPEAAVVLQSNVSHLVTELQKYLFMYGSVMSESLKVIFDLDLSESLKVIFWSAKTRSCSRRSHSKCNSKFQIWNVHV